MLRSLSNDEHQLLEERRQMLYTSEWTIDNLTAILMDPNLGNSGLSETTARAKARGVFDWLRNINGIEVSQKRPK